MQLTWRYAAKRSTALLDRLSRMFAYCRLYLSEALALELRRGLGQEPARKMPRQTLAALTTWMTMRMCLSW